MRLRHREAETQRGWCSDCCSGWCSVCCSDCCSGWCSGWCSDCCSGWCSGWCSDCCIGWCRCGKPLLARIKRQSMRCGRKATQCTTRTIAAASSSPSTLFAAANLAASSSPSTLFAAAANLLLPHRHPLLCLLLPCCSLSGALDSQLS